ncbi:unnamed protein product [Debaryomyces tyrocola]|nr:unnamed protein product [Debaryomyces tyrocola]
MFKRFVSFKAAGKLKLADLNKLTINAKYAVRGKIPIRADELREQLNDTNNELPFKEIIYANIGNPQQLDQAPLTWYRQVLSVLQNPKLLNTQIDYPKDVIDRAKLLLENVGSVGAYSHSQGNPHVRKSVADFITRRDGFPSNPSDIFLTGGASAAVSYLLQVLSSSNDSGFMIPIPQYPLYTATIALNDAVPIGYYLNEENNWSTNPTQIRELIKENNEKGIQIKALVVINPGNPTGSILSYDNIVEIINIAAEYGIAIIADEVYQENVFEGEFVSVKKVLSKLNRIDPQAYNNVQLASLHSTSKGVSGECGQRGGYMELVGFSKEVRDIIFKLASINLCSVVSGQTLVELMINPPTPGSASYELYKSETSKIHKDLQSRADLLYKSFIEMEGITCNKPMGAMYLFPKLNFTPNSYPKLFEDSENIGATIDEVYCIELLENTGICCIPGSGFGQVPDTYHLRTTFLPPGSEWIDKWVGFHNDFIAKYKN